MKEIYKDLDGVPQFINAMEAAQRKSKRAKLVINDEYLHAVALKSLLQSAEYKTETREWSKLPDFCFIFSRLQERFQCNSV